MSTTTIHTFMWKLWESSSLDVFRADFMFIAKDKIITRLLRWNFKRVNMSLGGIFPLM